MKDYDIDNLGIIHQINPGHFNYDKKYIQEYNEFKILTDKMAHLRLGYLIGAIGNKPQSVIDFGYGNGSFLEATRDYGIKSYGTDISGYDAPEGCSFVNPEDIFKDKYDVFCFFDSLEHVRDLSFVEKIKADYIYISLPWCHYATEGEEWFMNWKHRKADEHLHHFDPHSLREFFNQYNYKMLDHSDIEDTIRKPIDKHSNILSAVFQKNKRSNHV